MAVCWCLIPTFQVWKSSLVTRPPVCWNKKSQIRRQGLYCVSMTPAHSTVLNRFRDHIWKLKNSILMDGSLRCVIATLQCAGFTSLRWNYSCGWQGMGAGRYVAVLIDDYFSMKPMQ